jgi:hypothetical protein
VSIKTAFQQARTDRPRCEFAQIRQDQTVKAPVEKRDANAVFVSVSFLSLAGLSVSDVDVRGRAFLNETIPSKFGKIFKLEVGVNPNSGIGSLVATVALEKNANINSLFRNTETAFNLMCEGNFDGPSLATRIKNRFLDAANL